MVEIQSRQTEKLSKENELLLGETIQQGMAAQAMLEEQGSSLSPQEIRTTNRKIAMGKNAEGALVSANINLVVSIAMRYKELYPYAPELEECVQEGLAGLIIASRKYDPSKGNKFSTMAFPWIRQAISRGVNSGSKLVRLPENRITQYTQVSNIERQMVSENEGLSREQIDTKVIAELGKKYPQFNKEDLYHIRNAASDHYSLNRRVNSEDASSAELMDVISQTRVSHSAELEVIGTEVQDRLDECLAVLSEVQRDVVAASFEVSAGRDSTVMTAKEVQVKHEIKPAVYREHLESGLEILRAEFASRGLSMADFI